MFRDAEWKHPSVWIYKFRYNNKMSNCFRSPVCEEIIHCRGDHVRLAVRVRVYPYPESACATWIMFACKYKSIVWGAIICTVKFRCWPECLKGQPTTSLSYESLKELLEMHHVTDHCFKVKIDCWNMFSMHLQSHESVILDRKYSMVQFTGSIIESVVFTQTRPHGVNNLTSI